MRILTVSNLYPPVVVGGAELYAGFLSSAMAERGHEIGVVTLGVDAPEVVATLPPWPYRPDTAKDQPRLRRLLFHASDVWRPDVAHRLDDAVRRFRPDVIHSHTLQGLSVSALRALGRADAAHVHTLHDYWLLCWRNTLVGRDGGACGPSCDLLAAGRAVALGAVQPDLVMAPSQAVFDEHAKRRLRFERSIRVVLKHPLERPRARPPRPAGRPPTVGYLGQINPNKGIATLVAAFGQLDRPGARLVVAGRGRSEDLVAGRDHEGIEYRGWVGPEEKERFFDDIDVLVVPSTWPEPAGLVICEATARGLPVVGTFAGGIPEYVPRRSRPLLVPQRDAGALAASMRRALDDPAAYAPAADDLAMTLDAHVDAVLAAYDRAIGARAG